MKTSAEYESQIRKMIDNLNRWRAENSVRAGDAVIQFNFPKTVSIIATVPDAIQHHYMYANASGVELLKAMWPWGAEDEPTVMMARIAIEMADELKGK